MHKLSSWDELKRRDPGYNLEGVVDIMECRDRETKKRKVKVVEKPEIIVQGTISKPYFQIKYLEVGMKDRYSIGYGSYDLENCFRWLDEEFEVIAPDENAWLDNADWLHNPYDD